MILVQMESRTVRQMILVQMESRTVRQMILVNGITNGAATAATAATAVTAATAATAATQRQRILNSNRQLPKSYSVLLAFYKGVANFDLNST